MFTLRERSYYSRLRTVHEEEVSGILANAQGLIQVSFLDIVDLRYMESWI